MPKKETKKVIKKTTENKVEKALVENFIALQRVMTNLSSKFDHLSERIDKLLDVFEISAKSLAEKDFNFDKNDPEILEKIEEILDQNKTIARGITLLHDNNPMYKQREPIPRREIPPQRTNVSERIRRMFPNPPQEENQYQSSIMSKDNSNSQQF